MNYLFYGTEEVLINNEISKIIQDNQLDDANIVHYNLEEVALKNIIEDANTTSLFADKKLIIVDNSYIFIRTMKKVIEQDTDILVQYLNNSNPDTILIFIINNDKIDSIKKICKIMKEKGSIKEFNTPTNLNSYIANLFDEYKIDNNDISFLIKRVGSDLNILNQEVNKLKTYKIDDKVITKEDIINLTKQTIDTNIFTFIDNIITKNKTDALNTYQELLKLNEEPIKIIIMLANKFRLMYQACELSKKGLNIDDIADKLNAKRYPIQLAIEKGFKYDTKMLLTILEQLADLDSDIKIGNIDKEMALELFILNL
ncbi:MAG: DNA polymerase III subunit delta [Bacilli bacterium]|nr:DNA polymerase III subunit delta [Bacilli bacterium]